MLLKELKEGQWCYIVEPKSFWVNRYPGIRFDGMQFIHSGFYSSHEARLKFVKQSDCEKIHQIFGTGADNNQGWIYDLDTVISMINETEQEPYVFP